MNDFILKNWKDIMSKTIVFFITIFFLVLFTFVFENNNAFIGVTTIAIIILLFDKDMADQPLNNSLKLLLLNLFMLATAIASGFNPSVFLLLNLAVCFLIGYYFSYDLDKPIYLPFMLQYLFLIVTTPTDVNDVIVRVMALLIGPFIFFLLQLIMKKRYQVSTPSVSLIGISELVIKKIELELAGKSLKAINQQINVITDDLRSVLYDQQINNIITNKECINYLNISIALEKINSTVEKSNISKAMQEELVIILGLVNEYLNNQIKINRVTKTINEYIKNYQTKNILKERLDIFNQLNLIKERLNVEDPGSDSGVNENFNTWMRKFKIDKYFDFNSLYFNFALKLSVGVTFIYLIGNVFSLDAIIWVVLSFVLTINYAYEISNSQKIINAFIVLISSMVFLVLFNLIQIPLLLLIIISSMFIYLLNYLHNNNVKLIVGGLLVIGVGLASDHNISLLLIGGYLLIGSTLGTIFNIYLLPFKLKDESAELKIMFYEVIKNMMQETYTYINRKGRSKKGYYSMNSLYLTSSLILERLSTYNEKMNINEPNQQSVRRHLSADVYEFYLISDRIADLKSIKKQFNYIFKTTAYQDLYPIKIDNKELSINDKLAIILLNNIIKELKYTKLKR